MVIDGEQFNLMKFFNGSFKCFDLIRMCVVRGGVPVKIIDSHKPNRDDERARIEALGGSIMHWGTWRVNGQLAVSRAIGKLFKLLTLITQIISCR